MNIQSIPPLRLLAGASCAVLATASLGASTILLDEAFPAGQRTTENLPTTAAWYGLTGAISQPSAGSIQLTHTGASTQLYTHFTSAASGAYTLALNETITASFDFQLTKAANTSSSIRIGLLNSGGTRVTADGTLSSTSFADDRGYGLWFNPASTAANNLSIRARDVSNSALFNSGTPWSTNFGTSTNGALTINGTQTYSVSISVSRTGAVNGSNVEVVTILGVISGGDLAQSVSLTQTSTTAANTFFAFDKLGIGFLSGATTGTSLDPATFTLSNVDVSVISAIPEPSAFALLAGIATLGCTALRRRR